MYQAFCLFLLRWLVWFVALADVWERHFTVMQHGVVVQACENASSIFTGLLERFGPKLGGGRERYKWRFYRAMISGVRDLSV